MEIRKKKPDLKNAFGVIYPNDPEKQREFEERLRADENYAYELAVKYEKGFEKGFEIGIEEVIEKGKLRKSLETARKMLEEGFSKDQILRITGLSFDDLKENGII